MRKNIVKCIYLVCLVIGLSSTGLAATQNHTAQEPSYPQYALLKTQLTIYQTALANSGDWGTIPAGKVLQRGSISPRVIALRNRLAHNIPNNLSLLQAESLDVFDQALSNRVQQFQQTHGLNPDGIVGGETLRALNVTLKTRIAQIASNIQRLKALPQNLGSSYVIVNIPNFSLQVIKDNIFGKPETILSMPVIVGKRNGLQSCTLKSQITAMELNPYWYVPRSIAVKDFLPILKRNPQFLADNGISMYTGYGDNDEEIDSTKVNWKAITPQNFSYQLRQDPGEDNPLGKIKFIFNNSCGIYLHDTSSPKLFAHSRRDFSHGCIRIAKPLDFAAYLTRDDSSWTKSKIESAINTEDNRRITLKQPTNLYIIYQTTWVDESGILQFRNDIYALDK